MADNLWALYLGVLLSPFVQEDVGLFAAAGLAASGASDPLATYAVFLAGLIVSDVWKYGWGRLALKSAWARRQAERPAAVKARTFLHDNLARTLLSVRFVPGLRMATYIAAGYVGAPFPRFVVWVVISAVILTVLVFGLFLVLGAALGESVRAWLPLIGAGLALAALGTVAMRARTASQTKTD